MSINKSEMSKLGFGLMRLPEKDGEIDIERVNHMVDTYMEKGFNYFDTAYVYHGGKSESVIKESLVKRYPRESFKVATKLPQWAMKSAEDADRIFNEQLERAGVDYFDFYLLHSIEDGANYKGYIKYNSFEWGMQKKVEGKIKHFGFSFHGTPELLEKLVSEHPEVEFVQIQLNYADWENPLVESGKLYDILRKHNIPIIVMEPVKGGLLANMAPELSNKLKEMRPEASIASWAMRFTGSLEGITTILSGMSDEEQLNDNLNTFTHFETLTDEEQKLIKEVTKEMEKAPSIPCTDCKYCCDDCPQNIKIPQIFKALNSIHKYETDSRPKFFYNGLVKDSGKAGDCIACGRCEQVCPQHLEIIELLKEASEKFDEQEK